MSLAVSVMLAVILPLIAVVGGVLAMKCDIPGVIIGAILFLAALAVTILVDFHISEFATQEHQDWSGWTVAQGIAFLIAGIMWVIGVDEA